MATDGVTSPAVIPLRRVERQCDGCTLCCKVLAIPEVPTEKDAWCPHAHKHTGCDIYATRPSPCREFRCIWLDGWLPEWARPDKVHGVVMALSDSVLQITEDPGWPGAASAQLEPLLRDVYAADRYVTIVCGEDVRVRAKSTLLRDQQLILPS